MIPYNEERLKLSLEANSGRPFQQCSKTVMDTVSDPDIQFDSDGICNYYHEYRLLEKSKVYKNEVGEKKLKEIVELVKASARGRKYDCITGVSGGVDSTYLILQAKKLGLNPLVVHFDNGWNSETAVNNIQNIVSKLGFDLFTFVIDWEEFKDIQLSYFKANVIDIEAITDHAIIGTLYKLAYKHGIKYILSGNNIATEAILPKNWIFNKADGMNIKDIHNQFGSLPLKTYPFFSTKIKRFYINVKKIQTICLLDYMDYNKEKVKETIKTELAWKDYGGKHYESIFTRFYQGYILPVKFNVDKRKAHLSNLICSGQITREQAIEELSRPIYDPQQLILDRQFVLKKLGLSEDDFNNYLNAPRREHSEFKHERGVWDDIPIIKPFRPIWRLIKKMRRVGND